MGLHRHCRSSSHNVSTIRQFIMFLREKEKKCFNVNQSTPKLIMMDFSMALISATVQEICKKNLIQYINRTNRIVTGDASIDLGKTFVHICYSHLMKRNKFFLNQQFKKTERKCLLEFCMHWFSRLVECRYLKENKELVVYGQVIFCTKTKTPMKL